MEQKFFFFDVDNTLAVWPTGELPDSARYTLDELVKRGHRVALATGRLQADAERFARRFGTPDFVADGGMSLTINYEVQHMVGLDREPCIQYLHYLESLGILWAVTQENSLSRHSPNPDILNHDIQWDAAKSYVQEDLTPETAKAFYKVYAYVSEAEEKRLQVQHMSDHYIRFGDCVLFEPMAKEVGVRQMMDYYGVDHSQAVVFGDGHNDLSMFCDDWYSIAMGNARQTLKAKANYITTSCEEDGIYKACKEHGWI